MHQNMYHAEERVKNILTNGYHKDNVNADSAISPSVFVARRHGRCPPTPTGIPMFHVPFVLEEGRKAREQKLGRAGCGDMHSQKARLSRFSVHVMLMRSWNDQFGMMRTNNSQGSGAERFKNVERCTIIGWERGQARSLKRC